MIIYLKQCGAKLKNRGKNFLQEGCKRSSLQPHFDVLHVSIRRQQCRVSQHVTEAARQGRLGFWVGRTGDVATSTSNHIAQMSLRVSRLFFVRPRFSIPDAATAMAGGDRSKKDAPVTSPGRPDVPTTCRPRPPPLQSPPGHPTPRCPWPPPCAATWTHVTLRGCPTPRCPRSRPSVASGLTAPAAMKMRFEGCTKETRRPSCNQAEGGEPSTKAICAMY